MRDCTQAVRGDQHGPPTHELLCGSKDQCFCFGIQLRGRFVQNEEGGILQERSRQAQSLHLTSTQACPSLSYDCFVSLWQCLDKFVSIRLFCSIDDFLSRCCWLAD